MLITPVLGRPRERSLAEGLCLASPVYLSSSRLMRDLVSIKVDSAQGQSRLASGLSPHANAFTHLCTCTHMNRQAHTKIPLLTPRLLIFMRVALLGNRVYIVNIVK